MKLIAHPVEKPWGRHELPPQFAADSAGERIGEIWFEASDGRVLPLLVKYIFTSERLSVQVHPDDQQARSRGLENGKTECWYILDAEPGATLALGFRRRVSEEELRAAALDGSIEALMDWKPARAGDFFYVPANTVHAIGAGISLIEVQQQSDTTYRLYDYGRPRELHLDDGLAVSERGPYPDSMLAHVEPGQSRRLVGGPHFTLLYVEGAPRQLSDRDRWVIPLRGSVSEGEEEGRPGDCLFVPAGAELSASSDAALLIAAEGST